MSDALFEVTGLRQTFRAPGHGASRGASRGASHGASHGGSRGGAVQALDGIDLRIECGEFVVLRGPSGCGKSTLLLALGSLRRPTSGSVCLDGRDVYALPDSERRSLRMGPIGFVFQEMHLLPYLNARANVALAVEGVSKAAAGDRAREVLEGLGLGDRLTHKPSQLSAGERQRVAVARALVRAPRVILADEPTGSLDPRSAAVVLGRLGEFQRAGGTVVLVTHAVELELETEMRCLDMRAGRLVPAGSGT